jgi:hypothetical protein
MKIYDVYLNEGDSSDCSDDEKPQKSQGNQLEGSRSSPSPPPDQAPKAVTSIHQFKHIPPPIKIGTEIFSKQMSSEEEVHRAKKFKNQLSKRIIDEDGHTSPKEKLSKLKSIPSNLTPPSPLNRSNTKSPDLTSPSSKMMQKKRKSFDDQESDDDITGELLCDCRI